MRKTILAILLTLAMSGGESVLAQDVSSYNDAWFLLLNQYNISPRWSIGNEFHYRRTNFLRTQEQLIIRPSLNFKHNESLVWSVGYSYILSSPYNGLLPADKPEHNFWEQATLKHSMGKLKFSHRYRMEHRFSGQLAADGNGGYEVADWPFSHRFRYRITVSRDLGEKWFVNAFDELWVNFYKNLELKSFDRNWFFAGVGYKVIPRGNVQIGYLHQWINLGNSSFERHPTLQIIFQYDLNASKG